MTEEPQWTAWKAFLRLLETETWQESGIGRYALREEFERGTLTGVEQLGFDSSSNQFPKINSFYSGILSKGFPNWESPIDLTSYWTENGLTKPTEYIDITVFSRRSFEYAQVMSWLKVPDLSGYSTPPNLTMWFCGLERGGGIHAGIAAWRLYNQLVQVSVWSAYAGVTINVTSLLPTDYMQYEYWYTVKVNKNCVEFYVGNRVTAPEDLVAVVVTPACGSIYTLNGPPYAIAVAPTELSTEMNVLMASNYSDTNTSVNLPLSPRFLRASDGDPKPPRVYILYDAGTTTLFTDLTITAGSETSHPFPLFGYEGKTIYFQADQAGSFDIEVLDQTGNWRVHSTIAFLVNTLSVTTITDEAILGRIVVTPTAFPCEIDTAELVLR